MALTKINFKTIDELKTHLKTHKPSFFYSSQTSTVIPYDKLEEIYKDESFYLADLSLLPATIELSNDGNNTLKVKGPVNWKDAKQFLRSKGRNIMTSPTEDLALITAGAATSATGERSFHFGNLRSQIKTIEYLDFNGDEVSLSANDLFSSNYKSLSSYNSEFARYERFKNGPFPRFNTATDLLIGTEGQLGVITEIELDTTPDVGVNHIFMLLPKWENGLEHHMAVIKAIQNFRDKVILCEFIDANSFEYLPESDRPNQKMDTIFFEVKTEAFEDFYENFLLSLDFLDEERVFELSESKFHEIRASIPRAVFEENSRMGVTKMGTDVQVRIEDFDSLMHIYQEFAKLGVRYNLFGHFGDAHLHFNFMPTSDQTDLCQKNLESMYHKVNELDASPFAEHGIGIIKQKYIKEFWKQAIFDLFTELKQEHDPHNQFFPQGYMNLKAH